jgi:hypothetical protein
VRKKKRRSNLWSAKKERSRKDLSSREPKS